MNIIGGYLENNKKLVDLARNINEYTPEQKHDVEIPKTPLIFKNQI